MACVENMFMQNLQKLIKIPPAKPAVSIETETLIPNLGFFAFHIAKKNPGSQVQQKSFSDYGSANSLQFWTTVTRNISISLAGLHAMYQLSLADQCFGDSKTSKILERPYFSKKGKNRLVDHATKILQILWTRNRKLKWYLAWSAECWEEYMTAVSAPASRR